jgi:hypothetical protein
MLASRSARAVKLSLCLVLCASLSGLPALAAPASGELASLEGQLVRLESGAPVSGLVLRASTFGGQSVYRSEVTDEGGRFALQGLPAGSYGLSVEAPEGVYQLRSTVQLTPGSSERVLLGLAPAASEEPVRPGVVDEEDDDDGAGITVLKNPLAMTLISLGGLALIAWGIDEGTDRDEGDDIESPESPSEP